MQFTSNQSVIKRRPKAPISLEKKLHYLVCSLFIIHDNLIVSSPINLWCPVFFLGIARDRERKWVGVLSYSSYASFLSFIKVKEMKILSTYRHVV